MFSLNIQKLLIPHTQECVCKAHAQAMTLSEPMVSKNKWIKYTFVYKYLNINILIDFYLQRQ